MKKIILIDGKWNIGTPALQYALKASKGTDMEIVGISVIDESRGETVEKAEAVLKAARQDFASEGVNFSSYVISDPGTFLKKIDDLMPASLVLVGDVQFSEDMVRGGVSIESLKEKMTCPVTTAEALESAHAVKKPAKGINWIRFIIYAIGSIIMYFVFFPMIKTLNGKLFMAGTVLGGLAIMAVVGIHAWVWGNTTDILPKLFKLEK